MTSQAGGSTTGGSSARAGSAGSSGNKCPSEPRAAAPTAPKNCTVSARNVDPIFTCGQADCAVRKALDLTCSTLPSSPSLSATTDGGSLFSVTPYDQYIPSAAHLMTVTETGSRVEDLTEFSGTLSWYSLLASVMSTSSSGKPWVFAGERTSLIAAHEADNGWLRSRIPLRENSGAYLAARMVDDNLGYLAYAIDTDGYGPHLVTWDGSCWTDQVIAKEGRPGSTVIAVDGQRQPWVAWSLGDDALFLRHPSGDIQNLLSAISGDDLAAMIVQSPLRVLPGGLDGSAVFPLVAVPTNKGLLLFSRNAADPEWHFRLMPEPTVRGTSTGDCPSGPPSMDCQGDPCLGATSCHAQVSASGSGFDLVRTQSGRTFVARVDYSSQGTYALEKVWTGGEFPSCYCRWKETSGTGTADLILMHVTEGDPITSHFRFDMGGAAADVARPLALAVRGDTLLVAAQLGGSRVTALTYIEIDTTRLP